jgi:hypothetical protein
MGNLVIAMETLKMPALKVYEVHELNILRFFILICVLFALMSKYRLGSSLPLPPPKHFFLFYCLYQQHRI